MGQAKVVVRELKNKDGIVEALKKVLQNVGYEVRVEKYEGEGGTVYSYEVLSATGFSGTVYVAVQCDHSGCTVEAPPYSGILGREYCKPIPALVERYVNSVVDRIKALQKEQELMESLVKELRQMGYRTVSRFGEVEADIELGVGSIKLHLVPGRHALQIQIISENLHEVIVLAKLLAKLSRGGQVGRQGS